MPLERFESAGGTERYRSAGFIDLQVNGFAGVDYGSSPSAEELARSIRAQHATGVTRFLATIITASESAMLSSIGNLARRRSELGELGASVAGLHIEGPHISPEDGPRGAHPKAAVRPPDLAEFERWQDACDGLLRMVTLAPEWPGALGYIEALCKQGITVAIGHTAATAAQIADAISAGATLATHLGNATFPAPHKFNPLFDQLADDRLSASIIADGFHLPDSFLRTAYRTKTSKRLILVTDAASPAGASPGTYRLGEVDVELHAEGRVTLAGGTRLAGSALTMDRAIGNMVCRTGAALDEAVAMATRNPARAIGLVPGQTSGDSVEFEWTGGQVKICTVCLAGKTVYSALY